MNRRITASGLVLAASTAALASAWSYEVPPDAVPLSLPPPAPPPIISPQPPPDPEPEFTPPPPIVQPTPSLRDLALLGVDHDPRDYFTLAGQPVYSPRLSTMRPFQAVAGKSCPAPRFAAPGVVGFGWSAAGRSPSEFEECGSALRSLSFFLAPKPSKSGTVEGVSPREYARWQDGLTADQVKNLAQLAAAAALRPLGASEYKVVRCGFENVDGYPVVAGKVEYHRRRGDRQSMVFSAALTAMGRGSFSAWAVCVTMVQESSHHSTSASDDAVSLARAFYYLNRDYSASVVAGRESGGPLAARRLPRPRS